MSDFDKEAEREKLREKYEQDEERRETTEQMSELLLKGATMTNAHCSDCGDPIFRYDGQEFCPTCQKPIDRGTDEKAAAGEQAAESGEATAQNGDASADSIEVTDPSDDASVQFGSDAANAESSGATDQARDALERQTGGSRESTSGQATDDTEGVQETETSRQVPSAAPSSSAAPNRTPARTGTESTGAPASESVGDHLGQAQVVLAQTVERHARLAAAADSPRETRDHLETAREAAETLDATGY